MFLIRLLAFFDALIIYAILTIENQFWLPARIEPVVFEMLMHRDMANGRFRTESIRPVNTYMAP